MKKIFYIIGLLFLIIIISYYNTYIRESFENNSKTIVLLGDSILKNDAYVSNGKTVEDWVMERNKQNKVYSYAEDHSKIIDIFGQIDKIPIEMNSPFTYIFLSAGGNDILTYYVDENHDITDTSILKPMFSTYKKLVKSIQTRLPNAKIVLLDVYYPNNMKYSRFHNILREWNDIVYSYSDNVYDVLKISNYVNMPDDFSFEIEPSSNGGKKIAELIVNSY